jgi:hypothetical protein
MKINREKLVNILSAIKPGLAKKQIVEAATHFIFTGQDVLTYNDSICIIHPFDTDFKCSISANEFYKILSNISAEEIEITLEEDKLKIKTAKTKVTLATSSGESILDMIENLKLDEVMKKLTPLPEGFLRGVELCSFSTSKSMAQPVLTCVLIKDKLIMSSDDLRISKFEMQKAIKPSILLPASAITELVKFPVEDYCISDGWAYFATKDDVLFCSRLVIGEHNDYEKYFEGMEGTQINLPEDLAKMIESASVLTEGEYDTDRLIEIEIEKGKIRCKGENSLGWIENETTLDFKQDKSIKFSINPIFLMKILEYSSSMIYQDDRALFSTKGFDHLMALKID